MPTPAQAGAILTIDLDAVVGNWRRLAERCGRACECGAVVKADGYGLGAEIIAPALHAAGCRTFFVAHVEEGIRLRRVLSDTRTSIVVFNGPLPGSEPDFTLHRLLPVLNSPDQIGRWGDHAYARGAGALDAALHVDTGMARLGLSPAETAALLECPDRLDGVRLTLLMSHLACGDDPACPLNEEQRRVFGALRRKFPGLRASLANSPGIFLGPGWRFDLARPGAALYGVNPTPLLPNPMAQVVRLQGKIIQVRDVDSPQTVGYGATYRVPGRGRIATVAVGYADGYLRSLSNRGCGFIGDVRVPLVGRVSMDLATFDVSAVPVTDDGTGAGPGTLIDLIGPRTPIDAVAADAGTIAYEILTSLGGRYHRQHLPVRSVDVHVHVHGVDARWGEPMEA
ncbi:MAG: alanine racemase [Alphaproteobacteria bacterium]